MEHELFQSKLKALVDRALLSDIIESSSSGEHLHRTVAIELVLERSIQERHEKELAKVKRVSQPDRAPQPKIRSTEPATTPIPKVNSPVPQPKRNGEVTTNLIPKADPPVPAPVPQPKRSTEMATTPILKVNPLVSQPKRNDEVTASLIPKVDPPVPVPPSVPAPTPQPKRDSKTVTTPIPQTKSLAPATVHAHASQPLSGLVYARGSEASPDSILISSKSAKKAQVA